MGMNFLFTLNRRYLPFLISLIRSLQDHHKEPLVFYIFSNQISLSDIHRYDAYLREENQYRIIRIPKEALQNAPVSKRYPREMYYRIFAAKFLPQHLDRILYLDPDIIVKGNLSELYSIDFHGAYYAGATNIRKFLKRFNQIKNGAAKDTEYINTGVLMMNLELLRAHQNEEDVYRYIEDRKLFFTLPDQDIISTLYGDKVILIDKLIYNLSDRAIAFHNLDPRNREFQIDLAWVDAHTKIIHYYGKNKPWRDDYKGILAPYYLKYAVSNKSGGTL